MDEEVEFYKKRNEAVMARVEALLRENRELSRELRLLVRENTKLRHPAGKGLDKHPE